jgi:hypothetical protein
MNIATPPPALDEFDVKAVNKRSTQALYKKREKIYPKRARGFYRRLKWIVMMVTLTIYYVTPWLRWDRGPGTPDQAVLIDFPQRRFYFFFIEIWPQEVYYLTGLLIMAGVGLFLMTSVAGRVWCGYTCPQTVWTDLFLVVERAVLAPDLGENGTLRFLAVHGPACKENVVWILNSGDRNKSQLALGAINHRHLTMIGQKCKPAIFNHVDRTSLQLNTRESLAYFAQPCDY